MNCYLEVSAKTDGTCPNCRKHTEVIDAVGDEADRIRMRTLVTVSETERLPSVCCRCSQPTDRLQKFRFSRRLDGGSNSKFLRFLFFLISPAAWAESLGLRSEVCIRMPHCAACESMEKLSPRDVMFEHFTMRFVVHKGFRRIRAEQKTAS